MAKESLQRRLAAIVSLDVVGYSRLMEQDEVGTLSALKHRRLNILMPLLTEKHGRVVKLMGDGLIAEFGSAVNAVQWAVELQAAMAEANIGVDSGRAIVLRIGINLGDVMVEDGDLYGDGVNVAARLQALADPGGIFVSSAVHDFIKNKVSFKFEDAGAKTLKNIATTVQCFRVVGSRDLTPGPVMDSAEPASVAVLPFTNMSGDPSQQYFSDGITEDIITELSRFRTLKVIARNSSFQFRDRAVDVHQVGRELGVRYVVEGSVRQFGARVRITVQLIDAHSRNHLWSERYDGNIDELFEVQDEVTRTIVATMTGRLEAVEIKSAVRRRTDNLSAYDMLLRGLELLRGRTSEQNRRSRELFEQAVGLDPHFALAHAYLALALLVEHRYDNAPEVVKDRALDEALRAVKLDPSEGRCHQFLAQAYRFRGDFDLALTHFQRAIALNPNDANAYALLGSVLAVAGQPEEGIIAIRQAMHLNPFHPQWYWTQLGIASYVAGRYDEAIDAHRQTDDKAQFWYLVWIAASLARLGRQEEARATTVEILKRKPDFRLSAVSLRYRNPADHEHVMAGIRLAGLPD